MAVTIEEANQYFETSVLHNDEWVNADAPTRTRALNNAKNVLYRVYGYRYNEIRNPLPNEAIFEQSLWLLRVDDTIRRTEQGVTSLMVDGIQIALSRRDRTIAPQVILILGRKVGRQTSGRTGYRVGYNDINTFTE